MAVRDPLGSEVALVSSFIRSASNVYSSGWAFNLVRGPESAGM